MPDEKGRQNTQKNKKGGPLPAFFRKIRDYLSFSFAPTTAIADILMISSTVAPL